MVNVLMGVFVLMMVALLAVITKLRSDLCYARWVIERLTFLLLTQGKTDAEFWQVSDPTEVAAYAQGEITLQELFWHFK